VTQVVLNFTAMMSVILASPTLEICNNKPQNLTLGGFTNEFLKTKPKA
jgi:hypothetical protein